MKKVLLLAVIFGGAVAFTSCSKQTDHTCDCKITNTSGTYHETTVFVGIEEDAAETTCTSLASNWLTSGQSATCSLVN